MVQVAGPVCTVILNGKKQDSMETSQSFLHGRINAGQAKCIRCGCQILTADGYTMMAKYEEGTPDFPCWTFCIPCNDRVLEFAETGA